MNYYNDSISITHKKVYLNTKLSNLCQKILILKLFLTMIYRNLGNSGLKVSVISVGNMINYKPENQKADQELVKTCLQKGINFFDTSEIYQAGQAEIALGKYLKASKVDRQSYVVSTKIWTSKDHQVNSYCNTSRKHLHEAINQSLKRLQLDYVDVLFAHRFDQKTPLEEICRGFNEIIQEGKAFYWGTSDWDPQAIYEAFAICQKLNLHKPIVAQVQYNLLQREQVQKQFRKLIQTYKFGIMGWSALAGGILTGKYLSGIPQNQVNRFTDTNYFSAQVMKTFYYDPYSNQSSTNSLKKLHELADRLGCKMNHLALAWIIKCNFISTALIGARNSQQLVDNLKSLQILDKLTPQVLKQIQQIVKSKPTGAMNFLNMKQRPGMRDQL